MYFDHLEISKYHNAWDSFFFLCVSLCADHGPWCSPEAQLGFPKSEACSQPSPGWWVREDCHRATCEVFPLTVRKQTTCGAAVLLCTALQWLEQRTEARKILFGPLLQSGTVLRWWFLSRTVREHQVSACQLRSRPQSVFPPPHASCYLLCWCLINIIQYSAINVLLSCRSCSPSLTAVFMWGLPAGHVVNLDWSLKTCSEESLWHHCAHLKISHELYLEMTQWWLCCCNLWGSYFCRIMLSWLHTHL